MSHLDVGDDREAWLYGRGSCALVEVDGLSNGWQADDLLGPVTSVTLDGSALELTGGAVRFTSRGTITVNGEAMLSVVGGASTRKVVVRFLGGP